ncbi:hypothetical protein ACFXDE_23950 [Kitasatospora sp. NPDC059408]|uniref:hypothetical protein n=1 Tax=Kitasatospora sp. NPDC059408 TaxID=3346823 RepID=UPI0036B411A1
MTVFACVTCDNPLTGALREARPAADGGQRAARHRIARPRMAQGAFSAGRDGAVFVVHPDDVPGTRRHPDSGRRNGCCGPDGLDGPNLVCAGCGAEVATKEADCWTPNLVALIASAVRVLPEVTGGER